MHLLCYSYAMLLLVEVRIKIRISKRDSLDLKVINAAKFYHSISLHLCHCPQPIITIHVMARKVE